ncbi:DUF3566 domain-containing protein [Parenemella sanctibonifatiensis]|uniref:DUF3566 domain-containing protein n=1 Tax=Parenemella sanctibonifatiensis TaxID=2016505 RepID=A0A255EGT4_9ACTN|nr:DUF3566 domain-containing protein [Parenemella sanctibonifatiensis]OYN90736.1 hypothetical protein CGZ92_00895 [Parenemella sanctibonifatiensis]
MSNTSHGEGTSPTGAVPQPPSSGRPNVGRPMARPVPLEQANLADRVMGRTGEQPAIRDGRPPFATNSGHQSNGSQSNGSQGSVWQRQGGGNAGNHGSDRPGSGSSPWQVDRQAKKPQDDTNADDPQSQPTPPRESGAGAGAAGVGAGLGAGAAASQQRPSGYSRSGAPQQERRPAQPTTTTNDSADTATSPTEPGDTQAGSESSAAELLAARRGATRRRTRRARLRLARIDPWSVMKISLLFSIAAGIIFVVAVSVLWMVLAGSGLFEQINNALSSIVAVEGQEFDVTRYIGAERVIGAAAVLAAVDVVILTALATLGAFLYNLAAIMLGGLEVTLSED